MICPLAVGDSYVSSLQIGAARAAELLIGRHGRSASRTFHRVFAPWAINGSARVYTNESVRRFGIRDAVRVLLSSVIELDRVHVFEDEALAAAEAFGAGRNHGGEVGGFGGRENLVARKIGQARQDIGIELI